MKIDIISTFISKEAFISFFELNSDILFSSENIRLIASINTSDVTEALHLTSELKDRVHIIPSVDNCYSEGWNTALDYYYYENLTTDRSFIMFLGDGDKLIRNPNCQSVFDDVRNIYVFPLCRSNNYIHTLPTEYLFFASIGAWTPACAFPAQLLVDYRFPTQYKIASDVDVFLFLRSKRVMYKLSALYNIEMDTGGISSVSTQSVIEYYNIYTQRFGFSFFALSALCLKLLKLRLMKL